MVFDEDGRLPYVMESVEGLPCPFCLEFFMIFDNLKMSFIDGGEILSMALQQERECRHIVEQQPHEEGGQQPLGGQVLDEEVVVVAEVEEGLEGVVLGQGAAADVEDDGAGFGHDAVAVVADAPAEVDLLHVGEEVVVEAAEGAIDAAAHEQGGAGGPENVGAGIVLTVVFLDGAENTAAAEGITVLVEVAAASASVLKMLAVAETQYLWLYRGNLRIGVQQRYDGLHPSFRHLDVGIEEAVIFGLHLGECHVVA